jgi:hypothetical protein
VRRGVIDHPPEIDSEFANTQIATNVTRPSDGSPPRRDGMHVAGHQT